MNKIEVDCPECGHQFELTETLAAPLVEAQRNKAREYFKSMKAEMAEREVDLKSREAILADADAELDRRLVVQKEAIQKKAAEDVTREFAARLADTESTIKSQTEKLKVAEAAELEARRLKAEADEAKRTAELTVQRQLDDERQKVRKAALMESEADNRLRLAEKDKQLDDMRTQIEELRRKGNSGSQQLQGDVQEMDLATILEDAFPSDSFARVKKGQAGGDVIQGVNGPGGAVSGTILWEAKRTKNYSATWLPKLRDDQGEIKADLAVLMSEALPDDVQQFDYRERVWLCSPLSVIPLAAALRQGLIETSRVRRAIQGSDSKKDQIFEYLTGSEFSARISGIVDAYAGMREGLDTEKRSAHRQWNAREKQLERLLVNAAGLYGDMQGIAGASIQQVEGLKVPQLEDDSRRPKLVVNADMCPDDDTEAPDEGE